MYLLIRMHVYPVNMGKNIDIHEIIGN